MSGGVSTNHKFSSIILVLSLAIPSREAKHGLLDLDGVNPFSNASSTLLHQSLYEMASSLVVSLKSRKMIQEFCGLWNSCLAPLHSLYRAQLIWWCLSGLVWPPWGISLLASACLMVSTQLVGSVIFVADALTIKVMGRVILSLIRSALPVL